MSSMPKVVYHYCSLDAFMSIIQKHTFRLTNVSKSNDYDEIRYCVDGYARALQKACNEYKDKFNCEEFIDFRKMVETSLLDSSLLFYAICFSSEKDLLSQWRGYADDGKGIAIGISTDFFEKIPDDSYKYYDTLGFSKITYGFDSTQIKNDILSILERKCLASQAEFETEIFRLFYWLICRSVFYKNPAFLEENEWRLVYYPFGRIRSLSTRTMKGGVIPNNFFDRMSENFSTITLNDKFEVNPMSFIKKGDSITSYIDLSFEKNKKYLIREIVFGPKSNANDNELKLFLLSNGYPIEYIRFTNSCASYR